MADFHQPMSLSVASSLYLPISNQMQLKILEKLHQLGYIHNDIKPSNICFESFEEEKDLVLIDFGLATKFTTLNTEEILDDSALESDHIKPGPIELFRGNLAFASCRSMAFQGKPF